MRIGARLLLATLVALAFSAPPALYAQDRDRDRSRAPAADRERTQDRGRARDRGRDRSTQLHVDDRYQFRQRDIYGAELMSSEERHRYYERLEAITSDEEWARFRAEHQAQMQQRAREQNVELPAPLYGQALMTDRERVQLRERLQQAESERERERILSHHREDMVARARQHEIRLSEVE